MTFPQTATLWVDTGLDEFNQTTFDAPAEINVRWEDSFERVVTSEGEENRPVSRVYTDSTLQTGDYIYLGSSILTDPLLQTGAYRVLQASRQFNLKNTEVFYRAILDEASA